MTGAAELEQDLRALGIEEGETLLVQSSLRSLGGLDGGPEVLLRALLATLGERGTLVVFTATPENSNTSRVALAPTEGMTEQQEREYWRTRPPFDPDRTPASRILGHFSELVRQAPGAVRSRHPQTSFAAIGLRAADLTADHLLDSHLGPDSPVGWLYRHRARALLIGVPAWCCTALHLAEYLQPDPPLQTYGCVLPDGHWTSFEAVHLRDEHFPGMTGALEAVPSLIRGGLGAADCFLMDIADGVTVADRHLRDRRRTAPPGGS
ncbi:aminoglycoside N(3)-acetyltransferase [Kitasatospora sp. NPDC096147]|uniref:aminoglycoside N(3)-acetyltransferase n=1 Tax=Kitasatospora sp. NPDC096147 TaxID=3364093 RepID=UPI0038212000